MIIFFIVSLICIIFFPIHICARENDKVIETIERLENVKVTIRDKFVLYDCNHVPNYEMVIFDHVGYAIYTLNNNIISECSIYSSNLPYNEFLDSYSSYKFIYVEPGNNYFDDLAKKIIYFEPINSLINIKNYKVVNQWGITKR